MMESRITKLGEESAVLRQTLENLGKELEKFKECALKGQMWNGSACIEVAGAGSSGQDGAAGGAGGGMVTEIPKCTGVQILKADGERLYCEDPFFGGSYVLTMDGGNYDVTSPTVQYNGTKCQVANVLTSACSCPPGYAKVLASQGGYFYYRPWDKAHWGVICTKTNTPSRPIVLDKMVRPAPVNPNGW